MKVCVRCSVGHICRKYSSIIVRWHWEFFSKACSVIYVLDHRLNSTIPSARVCGPMSQINSMSLSTCLWKLFIEKLSNSEILYLQLLLISWQISLFQAKLLCFYLDLVPHGGKFSSFCCFWAFYMLDSLELKQLILKMFSKDQTLGVVNYKWFFTTVLLLLYLLT